MKTILSIALSFIIFSVHAEKIPEPYCSIIDLPYDDHGWFVNAQPLERLVKMLKPKNVIEIGSWLGSSTRFIASQLAPNAKLYAIDTWKGSLNEDVHQKDPRISYLYHLFLSNVKHAKLTDKIIPVRMDSLEASKALNVKADLIYIDGAHDTESVINDILNWYPHLNPKGIICGDDWTWTSVQDGVIHCSKVLNKKVKYHSNFWWFE